MQAHVVYRRDRCIGCGQCVDACTESALALTPSGVVSDLFKCVRCGICAEVCPSGARELIGREMSVDEVVEEIEKDTLFYDQSGGGVTFSGGEPLIQPHFLLGLLDACKELDIHRTVDTSGYADGETVLEVAKKTDLFLYDLKHMDSETHRRYTGVPNEQILKNLELLSTHGARIRIRIPIIPGVNSDEENIDRMGSFVSSLPGEHTISLLPYHNAAEGKYERLDMECSLGAVMPPSGLEMEAIAKRLEGFGSRVKIGG